MKNLRKKISVILFILFVTSGIVLADNISDAQALVKKAKTVKIADAKYDYLHKARKLYLKEYDENPLSIPVLTV